MATMKTNEEMEQIRTNKAVAYDVLTRCSGFIHAVSKYGKDSTNPEVIENLKEELLNMQYSIIALIIRTGVPAEEFQIAMIEKLLEHGIKIEMGS